MKLARFEFKDKQSFGLVTEKGVIEIGANQKNRNWPQNIEQILENYNNFKDLLEELVRNSNHFLPLNEVKFLSPLARPGKLLALAGNYSEHIKECGLSLGLSDAPRGDTVPRPFIMPETVLAGDGDTIEWPIYSEQIDYEVEIAVVIGKTAKNITSEQAMDYIAGYCICNDISARSTTFSANRAKRPWDEFYDWLNGKWADGFLPMGPYIVTKDEIDDVQSLDIQLSVNGEVRQKSNTSMMTYAITEIVSFLSNLMTLKSGDVISTGTPAGVGHAKGNYLKAGDIIECQIQNLGKLTNKMGEKPKKFYRPLVN